jgi:lipopolysaccharide transport system ATP-binding protein
MGNLAISVNSLGKSFKLTPSQFGKRYKKRRVLTEDLSSFLSLGRKDQSASTFWALKDISFEVRQGEVLGIMGPNGAGKTTLLKVLSKITYPTHGQVDIWGRTGALLEVGTGFHSELTGRENIYLSGSIMGMTRTEIDTKFDEIVAFSGVEEFLEMPVKRFSSGMEMRLAFSVAAHLEAEILFIDEVLAVGDTAFRQKCISKIGSITEEEGRTILFVSHNLKAIRDLCTRAIVLNKGRLVTPPSTVDQALESYNKIVTENIGHTLAERKDRSGKGGLRITHCSTHDREGKLIDQVVPGNPVELRLQIMQLVHYLQQLSATIELSQPDGQILASLESGKLNGPIGHSETILLSCFIQDLPITPGVVQINVKVEGDGQVQDKITNAGYLIIGEGTGKKDPVETSFPTIKIQQEWELS